MYFFSCSKKNIEENGMDDSAIANGTEPPLKKKKKKKSLE